MASNKAWSVTVKNANGQTQIVNVFAPDANQAKVFAQRQLGNSSLISASVKSIDSCGAGATFDVSLIINGIQTSKRVFAANSTTALINAKKQLNQINASLVSAKPINTCSPSFTEEAGLGVPSDLPAPTRPLWANY